MARAHGLTPSSGILSARWSWSENSSPPPWSMPASGRPTATRPTTVCTWWASPGPALPFVIFRAWKVPVGFVTEEVRLIGPSGRTIHRWGPEVRRMRGAMDLTVELDHRGGRGVRRVGHVRGVVHPRRPDRGRDRLPGVRADVARTKLSKETEDGLKKSDVIWVGVERGGRRRTAPVWFAYKNGKIYVVSQREAGPEEQTVPGRARRAGDAGDHATERSRHVAGGVHGGTAGARGRRVGRGGEVVGRQAEEPRGGAGGVDPALARERYDIVELTPELAAASSWRRAR